MPLIETLTLELGPAIAKSIIKLWFRDAAIASDVGSSLVDLIKAKAKDVKVRQHAKRQFEEIGEMIAESVRPIFESSDLSDAGREAVASAVVRTLDRAQIDAELLADKNLEPTKLLEHLKVLEPESVKLLSTSELAYYQRIMSESSRYIADIASRLPAYSERTIGEVLRREDNLLDVAKKILEEVERIRDNSISSDDKEAKFETDYRLSVSRNLDKVELFGLGANVTSASRRHRLSVSYVTLSVLQQKSAKSQEADNG